MRKRFIATLSTMLLAATIITGPVSGLGTTPDSDSLPEVGSGSIGADQPDYDFEAGDTHN